MPHVPMRPTTKMPVPELPSAKIEALQKSGKTKEA